MVGLIAASCNSEDESKDILPSSATVRSFSLVKNDNVLPNLDSVFFSIDLYTFEIFNADSLPYGTPTNKLTPVILTNGASVIQLTVTNENGTEKTYNYLENSTDTIDFTNPVRMRVVSYDGQNERNYTVRVNVHQVPTDTLVWQRIGQTSLPSAFSSVNEQHSSMSPSGTYFCITRYQSEYSVAYSTDPGSGWKSAKVNMSFNPSIDTFTATNDGLYILDQEGNLHRSNDNGVTWSATGDTGRWLLGAYGSSLIGTDLNDNQWFIKNYSTGQIQMCPSNFPVTNSSNATSVQFEMAASPQVIITGGKSADGNLLPDSWGFDGQNWVKLSRKSLPEGLENMTIVPYFCLESDTTSWRVNDSKSVLLAMCGNRLDGSINETIYMSGDFGLSWAQAPAYMQLSSSVVPPRTKAQAFPFTGIRSRATGPIEEWEVPYIYLFGGVNAFGATYNTLFRGVITALTFAPLQ